ncbi:MAG: hypothetical protein AAF387_16790 [Pseudomonadota bacterium]
MTNSNSEKNIGAAVSLSIALAFIATSEVHATTQFPPAHTNATFQESKEASNSPVAGSYYRPNDHQVVEIEIRDGKVELAYSDIRIAPYYRAAN